MRGKAGILFKVAEAAVDRPDGVVREVIFPVVGEHTFEALVREARAAGTPQSRRVHTAVRASYGSYYRRMMPRLLAALDFRSNNGAHGRLIDALERDPARRGRGAAISSRRRGRRSTAWCARSGATSSSRTRRRRRPAGQPHQLRDLRPAGAARAAALQGGVGGGRRPLPQPRRGPAGRLRRSAGPPTTSASACPPTPGVHAQRFKARDGGGAAAARPRHAAQPAASASTRGAGTRSASRRSSPSPSRRASSALKAELGRRWPMTGLLDMLKEADLRVGFTDAFTTVGDARGDSTGTSCGGGCCSASTAWAPTPG